MRSNRPCIRLSCLLLMILLLITSCAVKVPTVSTYVLTAPTPIPSTQPIQTHYVLFVSAMTANPGYTTKQMIYVKNTNQLQEYSRHAWVSPPAQLFMPLMVQRIESKKYFRAVVTPPFLGSSDYRLDTRLVVLQQEFMPSTSQVRCVVEALLTHNKTGRVIASRRFQALLPAPFNDPESGVSATNQAAQQISEQIAQFVVATAKK